jgi:hypothetical protein
VSTDVSVPATRAGDVDDVHPGPSFLDRLRARSGLSVLGLTALLAAPLVIALGVLYTPRWYPLLDMAQTELRVRDVWSSHPPLIGLAGRIGPFGHQGSHPGPMSFWALWPLYQLFGASSWALEAAGVALNVIAIGISLWIARRRGGLPLLLAMAVVLALVMRAYGPSVLTQPWNPYLPVLFWPAFLLAVWSVLLRDIRMLVVVAVVGSFCMQTHISYLGLVGGLGLVAVVAAGYHWFRADREGRRRDTKWILIAVGLGVVLWIPPVIDQLSHSPGNLVALKDHFSDPPEDPIGVAEGLEVFLGEMNPWTLLTRAAIAEGQAQPGGGSIVPGLALLLVWAGSIVVAWKLRERALVALDFVIGVALALGAFSTIRIFGFVWYYLLLWAWTLVGMCLLTIGWAAVAYLRPHLSTRDRDRAARAGYVGLAAVLVVALGALTWDATSVTIPAPRASEVVGAVAGPTAEVLQERSDDAPFLVTWLPDPISIGAQGYGLLNELDRRGVDVKAPSPHRAGATPYHVMNPKKAKYEVHLAIGKTIDTWRALPGYEEIAYYDPRTKAERIESDRLREEIIEDLRAAGLEEKIPQVDENVFTIALEPKATQEIREKISRFGDLGLPGAVFIGPPTSSA